MRKADREWLTEKFYSLTSIDSVSLRERRMADILKAELERLGFDVSEDDAGASIGGNAGNLYGYLKGNAAGGRPVLFSAHMDTVEPGVGKKPVPGEEEGMIRSSGDTVLGADDVSGLVEILEGIRIAKESTEGYGDIEVLLTVGEEIYGKGSSVFDYRRIISNECYVADMSGATGSAAYRAPSIISFRAEITGKAAHAGFAPENGINALQCASKAIAELKQGHISDLATFNIGTISSGTMDNIVPELCVCTGECRSFDHEDALDIICNAKNTFKKHADKAGASLKFSSEVHIKAYETDMNEAVCRDFTEACEKLGLRGELVSTHGGSDNNVFADNGLKGIVLSCGMYNTHSTDEYTYIDDLVNGAELIAALIAARRMAI